MASNRIPDWLDQQLAMAADRANGLKAQEAIVGFKQNTEAAMRTGLTAAITARDDYHNAVADNAGLKARLETTDSDTRAFIGTARNVLASFLGKA